MRNILVGSDSDSLFQLGPVDRNKRRTEPFYAREILVTTRLIDNAFAPPLGLKRLHRDAIRLNAAIAAAFANELVDDDALIGVGISMALAAAAFLGGASLIVDQHSDARNPGKLFLHGVELIAMMNGEAGRPFGIARIFMRFISDHHNALGAFGGDLPRDLRHCETAIIGLTAGHRNGIIEKDLVSDVGVRSDRGSDR